MTLARALWLFAGSRLGCRSRLGPHVRCALPPTHQGHHVAVLDSGRVARWSSAGAWCDPD